MLIATISRAESDADAGRDIRAVSEHIERFTEAVDELFGDKHILLAVFQVCQNNGEFVTCQTGDNVRFSYTALHSLCRFAQQRIAGCMSELSLTSLK